MSKLENFRNTIIVVTHQGVEVDPGALWIRTENKNFLVLVDEDEYLTADFNTQTFNPVN